MLTNFKSRVTSLVENYLGYAEKNPWVILGLALLLSLLAFVPISRLQLDAELDDLLPRNAPTILAMEETNRRFGSADLFTIAIQMNDPADIAKVQDEILAVMEKDWEDALYVQVSRDNSFFLKHALLYIPVPHLERIVENLQEVQMELGNKNSLFGVDLMDETEGEDKEKRQWFDADLPQELGLPDEAADAFSAFIGDKKENSEIAETISPKLPDSLKTRLIGWHSDGTWNGVVQAALKNPSSDTRYVKAVLARAEKILAPIRERLGNKIDVGVEGSYRGLQEVESLAWNGIVATSISLMLIVFVIAYFFRSLGALFIILLQVFYSCLLTLAVAGLIYGRLNLYTVFVISILLGMGIDYSIHVLGHAQDLASGQKKWSQAFFETLKVLMKPMFFASITTIAGLLTLLSGDFVGFYEFGVIAAFGIFFSVFTAQFLLPVLLFFFQRMEKVPLLKFLSLPTRRARQPLTSKVRNWPAFVGKVSLGLLVLTSFSLLFLPKASFEHDFKNLRDTRSGKESKRHVGVALQSNRKSSQPVVALAKEQKTMEILHDTLLNRLTVQKDPMLRSFLTLSTFLPTAARQEERLEIIEEIGELAGARVFNRATGKDSMMIGKLRDMTDVTTFAANDIPPWALRLVQERDGSYGKIGFIYGNFPSSDSRAAMEFQERYGKFEVNGEKIQLYSSSFIYADIIRLVKNDSKKMSWLISLIIAAMLFISLRNAKTFTVAISVMSLTALALVGLMGLTQIKMGPFNLILVPVFLGVSVDSVIYLILGYKRMGKENLPKLYATTGTLIIASVVTTMAGYSGMLFVTHMGIRSIGQLALLGFSIALFMTLFLTPWLCTKLKV